VTIFTMNNNMTDLIFWNK